MKLGFSKNNSICSLKCQGIDWKEEFAENCSNVQERRENEDPSPLQTPCLNWTLRQLVCEKMLLYKLCMRSLRNIYIYIFCLSCKFSDSVHICSLSKEQHVENVATCFSKFLISKYTNHYCNIKINKHYFFSTIQTFISF